MEEEIDASPTSKKNYKKNTKYRIPQDVSTTVGKINRKLMKDDQNNGFGGQSTEDSNCLHRSQIWQSAYLLEEADKVQVARRSYRAFNQNERRMSRPAGFLSVTQLCASQQSITTAGNEVKESQWEVTESQFQKLDDVIKVSYDLEMRTRKVDTSDSVEMNGNIKDVSKDSTQPVEKIEDVVANEQSMDDADDHSLKHSSSVLQSILSEWLSSSPVKMKKTETEIMQRSPHFIFNKRRLKRTYRRKRKLNERKDNIHNLSKFFSQSSEADLFENYLDESAETVIDLQNADLSKPSVSLDAEEDFFGFDGKELTGGLVSITLPEYFLKCDRKLSALDSVTWPERFYDFDSNSSDNSPTNSATCVHDLFMEDEDIFANYQTQILNDEVNFEKPLESISAAAALNDGFRHKKNSYEKSRKDSLEHHINAGSTKATKMLNIFEDIERDFNITPTRPGTCFNEPAASTRNLNFSDFPKANRKCMSAFSPSPSNNFKKFKASEDEPKQTKCLLSEIHSGFESLLQRRSTQHNPNVQFTGFSTVTGKQIPVSPALIAKKMNIFQDLTVCSDELKDMNNWMSNERATNGPNNINNSLGSKQSNSNSTFTGFTTARGSRISLPSEMISKQTNIFEGVEITEEEIKKVSDWICDDERKDDANIDPAWNKGHFHPNPNRSFTGFSTAGGKPIPASSALISKKRNIFQNVAVTEEELTEMDNWICDNDISGKRNVNNSLEQNHCDVEFNQNQAFAGFTTARGGHITMPSAVVSKKVTIFDDIQIAADELDKMNFWINDGSSTSNGSDGVKKIKMSKPLHNLDNDQTKQSNSTDLFREVTNNAQKEVESVPKKLTIDTFIRPSPLRKMSMMNSLRKLETLKENVHTKVNSAMDNSESVSGTSDTLIHHTSKNYVCVTPTNNTQTYSQIARESAAAIMEDDELTLSNHNAESLEQTPGFVSGFMAELTASSTPITKVENYRNRLKQRRLVETFDDIAGEDYFQSRIPLEAIKVNVSNRVKSLRKFALNEQQQSIRKKTNVRPMRGVLFSKKLTSKKLNWKEFVEHNRPVQGLIMDPKLTNNVLNVTAENATAFKFNAWDHYSDDFCRENINGIYLPDDIVVVMDENCRIGLNEISTAFLSCPSVDPKLVHHKWIENNMKWIVIKLASMERSFPNRFAGQVLSLENLMLQMKYRYDREIDRAERSAIRRICETDDVPEKRMILFVAGIKRNVGVCELELSDGWYSLIAPLGYAMERLVNDGKIKVGTKLVTQGANITELTDGCHPLDVSSNVKLKIYGNSTRRARWDSRLGYCKNPGPFRISLRSVWGSGGNIVKLRICVLRVYPVVYINPKKLADVHSDKVERRRNIHDDREMTKLYEKVYSQVSREYEEEEEAARSEIRPKKIVKLAEISSITDPVYLCELLDEHNDPQRIESELTSSQKTMVLNYKDKMKCFRSEAIGAKVKEKLASIEKDKCKFVPLLRFKVIDENSFDKTAVVTVWKPTEEILSIIQEGLVFDLSGSSARGISYNELQIYAGKCATFQKINVASQVPMSFRRRYVTRYKCRVANFLYPHCKVVAGNIEALQYLEANAKHLKLRRIKRIPINGAFHTELMASAVEPYTKALKKITISDPIISVHSNVDGKKYRNVGHILHQLPLQIVRPVKWEQMLHLLYQRSDGDHFPRTFECGGRGLTTILKQVNAKAWDNAFNIET